MSTCDLRGSRPATTLLSVDQGVVKWLSNSRWRLLETSLRAAGVPESALAQRAGAGELMIAAKTIAEMHLARAEDELRRLVALGDTQPGRWASDWIGGNPGRLGRIGCRCEGEGHPGRPVAVGVG